MLLWIAAAILTTIVVVALLWPLVSECWLDEPVSVASGAVYRDQFAEIEAERNRGLIGETEVEAARIEIARRLLVAADRPADKVSTSATRELRTVAIVVAAALPVLAIGVYLAVGAPGRPGQPSAARAQDSVQQRNSQIVANVEQRLLAFPQDGRAWDVIAPIYLQLGRYNDAADAFHHAVRLMGESPYRLAGLAEAHVLANDGTVTEVARKLFDRLGVISPERSESRFWLAVAAEQDGRLEEAAKAYVQLLADGSPGTWQATVAERWRAVRMRLGRTTDAASSAGERETRPIGKPPSLTKGDVYPIQKPSDEARK